MKTFFVSGIFVKARDLKSARKKVQKILTKKLIKKL